MEIHQIKIDFNVTENIKRYVYVYLLAGKSCWLIDSGTAGNQDIIIRALDTYEEKFGEGVTILYGKK